MPALKPRHGAQPSPPAKAPRPGRWLNVGLRGLHQVAVVVLGAAVLGAPVAAGPSAIAVLATGLILFAMDLSTKPGLLGERAGMAVLLKLALVAWMALDASARPWLFWLVVAWSTVFAHAPASFRHGRWI